MTRALDPDLIQAKNQLELPENWYYYLELEYADGQYLRFTNRPPLNPGETSVEFAGKQWDCTALDIGVLREGREGLQPSFTVRIPNVNRLIGTYVDQYDVAGRPVTVYRVLDSLRDQPDKALVDHYYVKSTETTEAYVTLTLGGVNVLEIEIPLRTFTRAEFPGIPFRERRGIVL